MRKKFKKVLSLLIVFVMVFSINTVTFASSSEQLGSNSVVIEENGIYINGNYYTQDEFKLLLDTAQKIDRPTDRMAGALVAGTWFIPGIGEVVITAAGVITVAGVVAKAGSWIYNEVVQWLNAKKEDKNTKDKSVKDKIDKVLEGKKKIKDSSNKIYEGSGGKNGAKNDFNKLDPKNKKTYSNGTVVGELSDGTKVNLRDHSSDGRITIEIQGKWKIKIRYND